MKHFNLKFLLITLCIFSAQFAKAQLFNCNVFMQGSHIEVGINTNGAYGSSQDPPSTGYCDSAYHPKGGAQTYNTCGGGCPTSGLGFVADPDKDGWYTFNPATTPWPYIGDYFLPGDPQEGWAIEINGVVVKAFNGSGFDACYSKIPYSPASAGMTGSNISYTTAGRYITAVWQGLWDSTRITQTTVMDTTKVFFTTYISIVNISHSTKNNVYYLRTVDPDNTEPEPGGSFATDNFISYQEPNASNKVLVSAIGLNNGVDVRSAYLGLGSLDCRATCFIISGGSLTPDWGDIDTMDNQKDTVHYYYAPIVYANDSTILSGRHIVQDIGIGLSFKLGNIAPLDSTTFAYAYILRQADIDSAFLTTKVKWQTHTASDSAPHVSGDTVSVCVGSIVPISILNGAGGFHWTWMSPTGNHLSDTAGITTDVTIDTGTTIVWAIGSSPACGNDTQVIRLAPFNPPPPIVSSNAPLCIGDTLKLSASGIPNSYFTWKGPNKFNNGNPYPYKLNIQPEDSGLYFVLDSIPGCPPQITSTNVLVDAVIAKISTNKPDACVGADFPIYFSGRAPDTNTHYKWDFDNSQPVSGGPGDTVKGPYVLRWDSIGTKLIQLRVQNWRCVSTTQLPVPIIFAPPVHFEMPRDVCINDSFAATVSDYSLVGADSLEWNLGGGQLLNSGNTNLNGVMHALYSTAGNKTVTLTVDYLLCTGKPYSNSLLVHSLPDAHINKLSHDVCEGDTVTFTADMNMGYHYSWSPVRQVSDTLQGGSVATILIPQSGNIAVQVKDQYNCVSTDTMYVNTRVCCTVSFPSAFTPNGDGRNDVFKPITIGNHHIIHFKVVNRYGQVVYESNDEKRGWDGRLNGVPQDMDTYFWFFTYNCNGRQLEEKGDVILVR